MIRIARIDNISAMAFRLIEPEFHCAHIDASPTGVYQAISEGACDAALLPVACIPRLAARVEPVGAYGIACEGAVHSVVLVAQAPIHRVIRDEMPVYVTEKSQTTRRLLNYLCRRDYGKRPTLIDNPERATACLWIGDDAVNPRLESAGWPFRYDMSQWWFERLGLPFVFARWVVRRGMTDEQQRAVAAWLDATSIRAGTSEGQNALALMTRQRMSSYDFALMYYKRIRTRLTLRDIQGMHMFLMNGEEERWTSIA